MKYIILSLVCILACETLWAQELTKNKDVQNAFGPAKQALIEKESYVKDTNCVSMATLKEEWVHANNDTKKWAVLTRFFNAMDAKEKITKKAKEDGAKIKNGK